MVLGFILLSMLTLLFATAFFIRGGILFADYQSCEPPVPQWKFWCPREDVLSLYDEISLNSVQALACAIDSSGTGKLFPPRNCPRETVQSGFSGVLAQEDKERCYGDSCVTCSVSQEPGFAQIKYEEDNALKNKNDIWYHWNDAEQVWEWRSPDIAAIVNNNSYADFVPFSAFTDLLNDQASNSELLKQTDIDPYHGDVLDAMKEVSSDFKGGLSVLLEKAKAGENDELLVHYGPDEPFVFDQDELHKEGALDLLEWYAIPGFEGHPDYAEIVYDEKNIFFNKNDVVYWWDGSQWLWKSSSLLYFQEVNVAKYANYVPIVEIDNLRKDLTIPSFKLDPYQLEVFGEMEAVKTDFSGGLQTLLEKAQQGPGNDDELLLRYDDGKEKRLKPSTLSTMSLSTLQRFVTVQEEVSCTVTDFKLPQEVSAIEEYIPFFGLPQRLVYWDQFPLEEDAWSDTNDFAFYTAIGAFVAIGPLKGLKLFTKFGKTPLVKNALNFLKGPGKLKAAAVAGKAVAAKLTPTKWTLLATTFRGVAGVPVVASYEIWKLKLEETIREYLESHPNELVFLKALEGKKGDFRLADELQDQPVLLQWVPGTAAKQEKAVHFVSPCSIDSMKVEKTLFGCLGYVKDEDTGTVQCITNVKGTYDEVPEDALFCEDLGDPRKLPVHQRSYEHSTLKPLLDGFFEPLAEKKMPELSPGGKFYEDGFYIVPLDVGECESGGDCKRVTLLYVHIRTLTDRKASPFTEEYVEIIELSSGSVKVIERLDFVRTPVGILDRLRKQVEYETEGGEYKLTMWKEPGVTGFVETPLGHVYFLGIHDEETEEQPKKRNLLIGVEDLDHSPPSDLSILLTDEFGTDEVGRDEISSLSVKGCFPVRCTIEDITPTASYQDRDLDKVIDKFGISEQSKFKKVCFTEGVVVKDVTSGGEYDPNYCVREASTAAKIGKFVSWTAFAASFLVGGWPGVVVALVSVGGAAVSEHNQDWPGGGIG